MRPLWARIVGAYEILAAAVAVASFLMVVVPQDLPLAPFLILLLPLTLMSVLAGLLLILGNKAGLWLSVAVQLIQLLQVVTPVVSFQAFVGFHAYFGATLWTNTERETGIYVNLVALVVLVALLLLVRRPGRRQETE